MAKIINELNIEDEYDEFGIRYPDGEVIIVDDADEAEDAVRMAELVVPGVDYKVVQRRVYISEWVESE